MRKVILDSKCMTEKEVEIKYAVKKIKEHDWIEVEDNVNESKIYICIRH